MYIIKKNIGTSADGACSFKLKYVYLHLLVFRATRLNAHQLISREFSKLIRARVHYYCVPNVLNLLSKVIKGS